MFTYGAHAYENKEWDKVVQYMEESLGAYLHAEDMCRKQCEGPFDQGWLPDFIPSIASKPCFSFNDLQGKNLNLLYRTSCFCAMLKWFKNMCYVYVNFNE